MIKFSHEAKILYSIYTFLAVAYRRNEAQNVWVDCPILWDSSKSSHPRFFKF